MPTWEGVRGEGVRGEGARGEGVRGEVCRRKGEGIISVVSLNNTVWVLMPSEY